MSRLAYTPGWDWLGLSLMVQLMSSSLKVPAVAEDTEGGVPAVNEPLLRVVRVREQVHGGLADAVLSGALGACVSTYEIPCLRK